MGGRSLLVTYVSILLLIPLAALLGHAFNHGLSGFWNAVIAPESRRALTLTLECSALAALINAVFGTMTAYVLVRDRFIGRSLLDALIDLPFALPTVVAGVTLLTLYGPNSPVHLNIANSWVGIVVAIMFVTLPFTTRSAQAVLESLDRSAEDAAITLGASPWRAFRTVTLPALMPAILAGTGLAFARAIGEYGSVVFISGNEPFHTEVASSYIYSLVGSYQADAAASVAVALLVISLLLLTGLNITARRLAARRG